MGAVSTTRDRRGAHAGASHWTAWLLLCGAAALLYLPHAGIPYYGDDYHFLLENPRAELFRYFVPYEGWGASSVPCK